MLCLILVFQSVIMSGRRDVPTVVMLATFAIVISWSDAVTVRDVVESEMKKARAQIHIGSVGSRERDWPWYAYWTQV